MVNLIAGERIVPELIQDAFTPEAVAEEAVSMLTDPARAARFAQGLARVRARLGGPGASRRAAEADSENRRPRGDSMRRAAMAIVSDVAAIAGPKRRRLLPADLGELSRDARDDVRGRVVSLDRALDRRSPCDRNDRHSRGRALLKGDLGSACSSASLADDSAGFESILIGAPQFASASA